MAVRTKWINTHESPRIVPIAQCKELLAITHEIKFLFILLCSFTQLKTSLSGSEVGASYTLTIPLGFYAEEKLEKVWRIVLETEGKERLVGGGQEWAWEWDSGGGDGYGQAPSPRTEPKGPHFIQFETHCCNMCNTINHCYFILGITMCFLHIPQLLRASQFQRLKDKQMCIVDSLKYGPLKHWKIIMISPHFLISYKTVK